MNKLSKDLFFSTVFSGLNILLLFWLTSKAEYLLSSIVLGVFLSMRRVAASFTNLSQLGASQAIIRFVSLNKEDKEKHKIYFFISIIGWFFSVLMLLFIYIFFGDKLAELTFNNNTNRKIYFLYTLWYIAILHLIYIVQPFFLTQRKIITYNLINTVNSSVIFLIAFIYFQKNVELIVILNFSFILMSILQLILLFYIIIKLRIYNIPSKNSIFKNGKLFYLYSAPRAIITFLDTFLLAIATFLVINDEDVLASFFLTIVLARTILVVLQPVSKLSSVIIGNNNALEKQKQAINIMTGSILYFTILFLIIMINWLNVLINFWLSKDEIIINVLYAFDIVAIGLIPYAIFNGLKGIIEVKFFKPYNLFSLIVAIILHVVFFLVLKTKCSMLFSLSISLAGAFISLGVLTIYWCRKEFYHFTYFRLDILLMLGLLLFSFNYYMNIKYQNIYGLIISVMITTIVYIIVLYFSKIDFIRNTIKVLFKK